MKTKVLTALVAGLAIGAVATPALAEVILLVTVEKTKTIDVIETIDKIKNFQVIVDFDAVLQGAAEAIALINANNSGNTVDFSTQSVFVEEFANFVWEKDAVIQGSVQGNTGIVGLNQGLGNMGNQGNVVSFAIIGSGDNSALAFTNAQAMADQVNTANFVHREEVFDPADPDLTATISNSVNDNSGVVGVNQDVGNMNNQHTLVALAVGFNSKVALAESALGQVNTNNKVSEIETHKVGVIIDSINGNTGIVAVNSSTGNMNNQAFVLSLAALTSTVDLSTPGF